jgi:response regulator RpfG family c-di-GMP phosphodiesterase
MRHSRHCCCPSGAADGADQPKPPVILTIDDDPNVSQALRRRFSQYKVTVLQAHHGTHGIWLATTCRPDVIITDMRMPQGRGQDVVAHLVRNPETRQIPIVVLTGVLDDELRRRMLNLGVGAYLIKPVSFEDLREAVGRFIKLERTDDEQSPVCSAGQST